MRRVGLGGYRRNANLVHLTENQLLSVVCVFCFVRRGDDGHSRVSPCDRILFTVCLSAHFHALPLTRLTSACTATRQTSGGSRNRCSSNSGKPFSSEACVTLWATVKADEA